MSGDERHSYYWQLLEAALAANRDKYGDYTARPFETAMTFQRASTEVEAGGGRVNIVSRATSLDLGKAFVADPHSARQRPSWAPRFLVMPEIQRRLEQVKTLDDLRKFSIGQSSNWTDVKILEAAGFRLVLSAHLSTAFNAGGAPLRSVFTRRHRNRRGMAGQPRGVPGLMIEKRCSVLSDARYFFVPRTAEGRRMAERIEDGLQRLRRSGEFERRYQSWKKLVLKDIQLTDRVVFRLPNPELSPETPLGEKFWWDDLSAEVAPAR